MHFEYAARTKVELYGLENSPALNGKAGHIVRFDTTVGRWQVRLETKEVVRVKPNNVRGDHVLVQEKGKAPIVVMRSQWSDPNDPKNIRELKDNLMPLYLVAKAEGDSFGYFVIACFFDMIESLAGSANAWLEGDLEFADDPDGTVISFTWALEFANGDWPHRSSASSLLIKRSSIELN